MPLGQTTLLLAGVDGDRPDAALLQALVHGANIGGIRLLDLVVVHRRSLRGGVLLEVDQDDLALMGLPLAAAGLIGVDDAAALCAHVGVGSSAAVVLVEGGVDERTRAWAPPALRARLLGVWPVPASATEDVLQTARAQVVADAGARRRASFSRRSAG
ncbi:DUF6325 family protein [Microbacterium esteraromaticum]|uniref:DUF6325 family protein n=1 Tax=Microbacterium esteraromaticum TaxID=57043 RepID=UPI001C98A02E|nr:DUF6325 family protein [Microbacterium esteraromaticum]MBY6061137.1 hypothetical protein [Microbacterium esteraromaticum]